MITFQNGSTGRPEFNNGHHKRFDLLSLCTFLKTNIEEKNICTGKKAYRKFPVNSKQNLL